MLELLVIGYIIILAILVCVARHFNRSVAYSVINASVVPTGLSLFTGIGFLANPVLLFIMPPVIGILVYCMMGRKKTDKELEKGFNHYIK